MLLEVVFMVWYWKQIKEVQKFTTPPQVDEVNIQLMMDELKELNALNPDSFRGWFFHAPLAAIYRGNAAELFSYAFYNDQYVHLEACKQERVHAFIEELAVVLKHSFTDGYNLKVKCMRQTMDPVDPVWRPLMF